MLRWLYIQLIRLHPAPFRWRFGDDMLDDFDRVRLTRQAAVLRRRRRPRSRASGCCARNSGESAVAADASLEAVGVPLFQTIETYKPHPAALFQGGLLAILSILAVVALIGKGGGVRGRFLIGVHSSQAQSLADRSEFGGRQRPQHDASSWDRTRSMRG